MRAVPASLGLTFSGEVPNPRPRVWKLPVIYLDRSVQGETTPISNERV